MGGPLVQGMGALRNNPEFMQQMMNSPMMQTMLADPELMRSILSQNPAISQVGALSQDTLFAACIALSLVALQLAGWDPYQVLALPATRTMKCTWQMMERNPDFAQMLNNPQLLRESMQLAANPVSPCSCVQLFLQLSDTAAGTCMQLQCQGAVNTFVPSPVWLARRR